MTKLVIQIPAYNEAQTLPDVLHEIPRVIDGVDQVIILVIDDGSSDNTADVALQNGADFVIRLRNNRGLSNAFMTGIRTSLSLGADIIVNTDADNQYPGSYICCLVKPIIEESADLVIADRMPLNNKNFSPVKQRLEAMGSWIIRIISGTDAPDAPSGFRAYTKYAALRIQVYNSYSYTLETLIQAGKEKLKIAHIPIVTYPTVRPSRLHKGMFNFIWHQSGAIVRSFFLYQPLKTFGIMGIPFLLIGFVLVLRFLILYLMGDSGIGRYIQSVSIGGTSLIFGFTLLSLGILGDGLRANRQILQEILLHIRDKNTFITENDVEEILGSPLMRSETPRGNKGE